MASTADKAAWDAHSDAGHSALRAKVNAIFAARAKRVGPGDDQDCMDACKKCTTPRWKSMAIPRAAPTRPIWEWRIAAKAATN